MTLASRVIDTGIASSQAVLPVPPDRWSYSTLREIAACPLRYCLAHARYPNLWDRKGYPPLQSVPALVGKVVHGALEAVVKALIDAEVASLHAEEATKVLRDLGGLTAVVERETARQFASLDENPRLSDDRRRRLVRELRTKSPDARAQVQTYLSRTRLVSGIPHIRQSVTGRDQSTGRERSELREGSHAEAWLVAEELRLHGRVDLLTIRGEQVDLIDYKTGEESQSHVGQLQLYALLWRADEKSNPRSLGVSCLTAAYRDHDLSADVPTSVELDRLSAEVEAEITAADREITSAAPVARPSQEVCSNCAVRHLCPSYWATVALHQKPDEGGWFDMEGVIGVQNGQRSWWLLDTNGQRQLLLRTTTPIALFEVGDRVRFLGLRRETDPEVLWPTGSLTAATEAFVIGAS